MRRRNGKAKLDESQAEFEAKLARLRAERLVKEPVKVRDDINIPGFCKHGIPKHCPHGCAKLSEVAS